MKSFLIYHTFVSMILLHILADFNLQIGSTLDKLKQKSWWIKQTDNPLYKNDYRIAMFIHCLVWSIIILIPITLYSFYTYQDTSVFTSVALLANTAIHYYIDDAKCNKYKINLVTDQTLHFLQITATFMIFQGLYYH